MNTDELYHSLPSEILLMTVIFRGGPENASKNRPLFQRNIALTATKFCLNLLAKICENKEKNLRNSVT